MNESQIRQYFAANWVFRLYRQKRIAYPIIVIGIPLIFLIVGAFIALLLGVFRVFVTNPLAYSGPIGIGVALSAYGWFANIFPKIIETLSPALDASPKQIANIIEKWATKVANRIWIMILLGIPIAVFNAWDLATLWSSPSLAWVGTEWATSSHPVFFAIYYGLYNIIGAGFLLGSGIAGIIGCVFLLRELLDLPIYLDLYRRLRAISTLSTGIAFWALMPFIATIVASAAFKPNATANLAISSVVQSIIASVALLMVFVIPLTFGSRAIIRAKNVRISQLEQYLHDLNKALYLLIAESHKSSYSEQSHLEEQKRLRQERETVEQDLQKIELISNWPVTRIGFIQLVGAAAVPLWSTLLETLKSRLFP